MKYFPMLFAFLAFAVIVIVAGCDSTPPSAADLDTTPLYSLKKAPGVPPGQGLIPPFDSTGFMTMDKDTSGWE